MKAAAIVAFAIGLLATLEVAHQPAPAAAQVDNGKLAISDYYNIFSVDPDGLNWTALTTGDLGRNYYPQWSPGGSKIVFASDRDGNYEIYTMNSDGTNQTRLTDNTVSDNFPAWSPDGSKIAYYRDDGSSDVYLMNADGSGQVGLNTSHPIEGPRWSPDGGKLVYSSNIYGSNSYYSWSDEIRTVNVDGTSDTALTNNDFYDGDPVWSPDGSKIALVSTTQGNDEVYSINPDGTGRRNLSREGEVEDSQPAWSPDGSKIAFVTKRYGAYEIYSMSADGTDQTNLTDNEADYYEPVDQGPEWSPDGCKIAFISDRYSDWDVERNYEVYTMNSNGTGQTRATSTPDLDETQISWQRLLAEGDSSDHACDSENDNGGSDEDESSTDNEDDLQQPGSLEQLSGVDGCVSETGIDSEDDPFGSCDDGTALDAVREVATSPDGKHVYAITYGGIAIFQRNQTSGKLTQLSGKDGCISESGSGGICTDGKALNGTSALTVSPDGSNVYVASGESGGQAVAIFERDPTSGKLTQLSGTDGCVSETGSSGECADAKALNGPNGVTVSPDGAYVYVASYLSEAVAIFQRDQTNGKLTQLSGKDGCISETGDDAWDAFYDDICKDGYALSSGPVSVIASPDGKNLYVGSSLAVAVFKRDQASGKLSQLSGSDGCVGVSQTDEPCDGGWADGNIALSPDGLNLYVADYANDGVATFERDSASGKLTWLSGEDGCVSESGNDGSCTDGKALYNPKSVTVAPDGNNVYVTTDDEGENTDAVAVFRRQSDGGGLTQLEGSEGCIAEHESYGLCQNVTALESPRSITVSPDGLSAYVASAGSDAVAVFAVTPVKRDLSDIIEGYELIFPELQPVGLLNGHAAGSHPASVSHSAATASKSKAKTKPTKQKRRLKRRGKKKRYKK